MSADGQTLVAAEDDDTCTSPKMALSRWCFLAFRFDGWMGGKSEPLRCNVDLTNIFYRQTNFSHMFPFIKNRNYVAMRHIRRPSTLE